MNQLSTMATVMEFNTQIQKLADNQDGIVEVIGELQRLFSDYITQTNAEMAAQSKRLKDLESQLNRVPLGKIRG